MSANKIYYAIVGILVITIGAVLFTIIKPTFNRISTDTNVTKNSDKQIKGDELTQIQDQLNKLYVFNPRAEGSDSSQVINMITNEQLRKKSTTFENIKYDIANDIGENDRMMTAAVPKYTQSLLVKSIDEKQIKDIESNFKNITDEKDTQASQYTNIKNQIDNLKLKVSIINQLNALTDKPIYFETTLDKASTLKESVDQSTLDKISQDIDKLEKNDKSQIIVVTYLASALNIINDQQKLIDTAQSKITAATTNPSDSAIKDAETAIIAIKSDKLKESMKNQLSKTKEAVDKDNKLTKALSEQETLKDKLEKEYQDKSSKLEKEYQTKIDDMRTQQDREYNQKIADANKAKNDAIDAVKSDLSTQINQLQQQNRELQDQNTRLRNQHN